MSKFLTNSQDINNASNYLLKPIIREEAFLDKKKINNEKFKIIKFSYSSIKLYFILVL